MKLLRKTNIAALLRLTVAAAGIFLSLRYAAECARGVLNGILFCIEALVPSLFLLMTVCAYIVKSGIAEKIARPFSGLSRALFRLPPASLGVILLALIGGYPVGARCTAMMARRGALTERQAEKTVLIAVCAGPGFLLNFVGRTLLGSPEAGVILLIAETLGVLLTGLIVGRTVKCENTPLHAAPAAREKDLLTRSVADASRATFHMCAMVVICSALIEVITALSPDRQLTDIVSALVEITSGCAVLCGHYPLAAVAFFVGFGGLAVHLQIFAAASEVSFNKLLFFGYRIIQGIITAAATYILLLIFPIEVRVFHSTDAPLTIARSATLAGSAALVLCSLCFLASITKHHHGGNLCAE